VFSGTEKTKGPYKIPEFTGTVAEMAQVLYSAKTEYVDPEITDCVQ
jgi:hypothetical protein